MSFAAIMLVAIAIDALIGWPKALHVRIGHPVTWLGALIDALERRLNGPTLAGRVRAKNGANTVALVVGAAAAPALAVHWVLPAGPLGIVLAGVLAWPLVATRSMHDHVAAVAQPLAMGDLEGARAAVAMIVGRDPNALDANGVACSALESLAENSSDGIVAPVFWGLVAGLPGIAAYKAINTMDSMIGHRTERFEDFGRTAARLDDLVNLIPARLTAFLFAAVSARPSNSLRIMRRDARQHRSPNAGWPEAAMAGALNVRLSGPRIYGDRVTQEPWLNSKAPDPAPETLQTGLALYVRAMVLMSVTLAALALI